jgi:hypothetical protein
VKSECIYGPNDLARVAKRLKALDCKSINREFKSHRALQSSCPICVCLNAAVYIRGRVWHPDHKTIVLNEWHRVMMNTEGQALGARTVVFLD